MRRSDYAVALLAVLAIALSLWRLEAGRSGLVFEDVAIGETPARVVRAEGRDGPMPVVVIAHGFAGSMELMEPFATTLARAGYLTVSFDFVGHGTHPRALPLVLEDGQPREAARRLLVQLDRVIDHARSLPRAGEGFALLGHSMATDLIAKRAADRPGPDATSAEARATAGAPDARGDPSASDTQGNSSAPDARATVMVSPFSNEITATSPPNMLAIAGSWEARLTEEAIRTLALTADAVGAGTAGEDETVGSFGDGTARRVVFASNVEHIGVLYDPESLAAARAWLDAAFGREGADPDGAAEPDAVVRDLRGPWIGLLFAGMIALARPLSRALPALADPPAGAGASWRAQAARSIGPAVLTPVVATWLPSGLMPIVVGDYLAQHFFLYGVFTALGLWLAGRRGLVALPARADLARIAPTLALAALAVGVWTLAAFALALDRYAFPFVPTADRAVLVPLLFAALIPWFLADEWLTRGVRRPGGKAARVAPYAVTKLVFVLSLALAVALDASRLFFLAIVAPVILVFFAVYGLLSQWAMRRTGHPWAAGGGIALALAWSIAVSFPLFAT
ncbi:MAG: serine aminopeptidase domain-containing protein [Paracoccaceae bacterium]